MHFAEVPLDSVTEETRVSSSILLRSSVTNFTFTHSLLRLPSSLPPAKQRKISLYSSNDLVVF